MKNEALHIQISGAVQGVGFRPFVYRLAKELGLTGWVLNAAQGVTIEVEGPSHQLEQFLLRLEKEKPHLASMHSLEYARHDPAGFSEFEIRHSDDRGPKTAFILPDIATCPDCLHELFDPADRRYRYPFINCTNCGPRFSIIASLPYDRPNTTMKAFTMCPECQREYDSPDSRRFHAQPNACPVCGPHLELWNPAGDVLATHDDALTQAAVALREGKMLACKGIGGFQLMVDGRNEQAVQLLRKRKHRHEKPFALMYPTLEMLQHDCQVSALEERLLRSIAAPVVLLEKKKDADEEHRTIIAKSVAPGNPYLGVMLPYTPLHHLLMKALGFPVVATSGNLSDEPICIEEQEALQRLAGMADLFLVHNRPIIRHVDDSVVRVVSGHEQVLRRARGYAPLPLHLTEEMPSMIAVGAHLKNTVAISNGHEIFTSQHIGDLETAEAYAAFQKVIHDFRRLYEVAPEAMVSDLHPEYLSTRYAQQLGVPVIPIQHHHAHVLACMADNEIEGPVLGVSWDGTGLGTDGTIWGGEFLLTNLASYERVAHFRTFRLPGGEAAIRQPRRAALGLLYEIFGEEVFQREDLMPVQHFSGKELSILRQMLHKGLNTPVTSSAGRLFDAVAAIIGLRQRVTFEGQAAMALEFAIRSEVEEVYPFAVREGKPAIIDWQPMILQIMDDVQHTTAPGIIAAKFHNTLTEMILCIAHLVGELRIVITGGCFQNKYLTEQVVKRLQSEGFQSYWHQRIPPNDGGIALGQLMAAGSMKKELEILNRNEYQT